MTNLLKNHLLFLLFSLTTLACNTNPKEAELSESSASAIENKLIKHTVSSAGHPMAVWEKKAADAKGLILFVHGRTYSSLPDFDLQVAGEDLSLMDGMLAQGYSTYAVDLRGYGSTPRDSSEWLSPNKAAQDILNVLNWIAQENNGQKVHLFGWSMGSTSSLLATQKNVKDIASLTVFGYWQDLDDSIPADSPEHKLLKKVNTVEHAASDFITPASISQKAIDSYVKMALEYDPIKVDWRYMNQFNSIDPSLISSPVLILQGEFDPIGPTDRQAKLFTRLKTADKSWVVISGGDHAAFLEAPRENFIHAYTAFIDRFNK